MFMENVIKKLVYIGAKSLKAYFFIICIFNKLFKYAFLMNFFNFFNPALLLLFVLDI